MESQTQPTDTSQPAESGQKSGKEIRPTPDENRDESVNPEAVIQKASRKLGFIRYQ